MTDDVDLLRITGFVEYARIGGGITRWPFDFEVTDDADPRVVGFLAWVRERYDEAVAARPPSLNDWSA